MKIWIIVVLMLFSSVAGAEGGYTGTELYKNLEFALKDNGHDVNTGFAFGVIYGIISSFNGSYLCAPDTTYMAQYGKIVLNYLDKRPEKWNMPAGNLILEALIEAWPCAKN
jgi:hypothetical protein